VVATEAGPLEATPATCNISGGSSNINPLQQQHSARANLTNQPTIAIANNTTNKNNYNNNVNNNYNNSTNTTTNNTNNCTTTTLKRSHLGNRERERDAREMRSLVTAATAATTTALATTITTTSRNAKAATTTTTLAITGNSSYERQNE